MTDASNILAEPIRLIERAVEKGSASIKFVGDERGAKKFYQRCRALLHGRAKDSGVWLSRDGETVKAIKDPKLMPEVVVE